MFRFVALTLIGGLLASGCLNPLAARRAQTLKPGEVEVLVIPEIAGIAGDPAAIAGLGNSVTGAVGFPAVTASLRFGVVDKLDLQLVVDPTIIPEISIGYQLVGDKPGDFALTLTAGTKPTVFTASGALAGWIHFPVGVLMDVPLGEDSALYAGLTVPPSILFGAGGGDGVSGFFVEPTVHAGLSLKLGTLVIQPEISVSQQLGLGNTVTGGGVGTGILQYAVGIGFGGRFGGPAPAPAAGGGG